MHRIKKNYLFRKTFVVSTPTLIEKEKNYKDIVFYSNDSKSATRTGLKKHLLTK